MEQEEKKQRKYYYPWVLLFLMCLAVGIYASLHYVTLKNNSAQVYKVAVVDAQAIMKKHREYAEYSKLQQELVALQNNAKAVNQEINNFKNVDLNEEILNDSLKIENNLVDFQKENTLNNEAISQRAKYTKELEQDLAKEIYAINQLYGTKIVSIQLKLDNRDKMLLTKDQVIQLREELLQLDNARYAEVENIKNKYDKIISDKLAQWKAERRKALGIQAAEKKAVLAVDKQQREQESNEKTGELVSNLQKVMGLKAQLITLNAEAAAKKRDAELLEKSMLADIASFATKVAIEDKYNIVMVKNLDKIYPLDGKAVINKGVDITDKVEAALVKSGVIEK